MTGLRGLRGLVRARIVLPFVAFAAGIAATVWILYDHTGREAVQKAAAIVGIESRTPDDEYRSYHAYFDGHLYWADEARWRGVHSPRHPKWRVRPGVDVERVATGFTYPVNVAFASTPPQKDDDVFFYVNELHGAIKYVTRGGHVGTYADHLINFDPVPKTGSDEMGLSGLTTVPGSEDLIMTGVRRDEESGLLRARVIRFESKPGGKAAAARTVLLEVPEFSAPSHQIQQVLFGPDGKLYVSIGEAQNPRFAGDMTKLSGKIVRMNPDGTACEDNPFYDPLRPDAPASFIWARGLRNVFDMDFVPDTGVWYAADNGEAIDRLIKLAPGASYGWDGHPESSRINALYTFGPFPGTIGPTGVVITRRATLGPGTKGRLYLGVFAGKKSQEYSRGILDFDFDPATGDLMSRPSLVIQHVGKDMATVCGIEEGPDGLYFADFFGRAAQGDVECRRTGSIWRVVPSEKTAAMSVESAGGGDVPAAARGASAFRRLCTGCHRINGTGGLRGPDLTHAARNLDRVGHDGYEARLTRLLESDKTFVQKQWPRMREVLAAEGDERKRVWLRNHLEEPRFDNLYGQMPSFSSLTERERDDIIEFLLSLN